MNKGLKKFFIICAAAVCMGLILSVVGYVTGGIHFMDKLSEKYTWFRGGNVERTYTSLKETDQFDSLSVKGDIDVMICKGDISKTRVSFDKNSNNPIFRVENGVLTVDAGEMKGGVLIDLGTGDRSPYLEVYVPEGINIKNIDIDTDYGDVEISDISAGTVSINADSGDISMDRVSYDTMNIISDYGDIEGRVLKSKGLSIEADAGDIDLQGEFYGNTNIKSDNGDTDIVTTLKEELYTLDLYTDFGDVEAGSHKYEDFGYINQGNGENIIKVVNDSGDINISFGR